MKPKAGSRKRTDEWASTPNDRRRSKMRTLTLSDESWARLGKLAEADDVSRSAYVEAWLATSQEPAEKHGPKKSDRKA